MATRLRLMNSSSPGHCGSTLPSFASIAVIVFTAMALGWFMAGPVVAAEAESDELIRARGAKIYASQCVMCHGGEGQGNEDYYPEALVGDDTVGELAELISETMPEEEPDTCVAKDAQAVAAFIHYDFYSEAAQIRRRPPRAVLSRLTGNQLRQSLSDLYGRFGASPWSHDERGLNARYYNGGGWREENIKIKRVDPVVDFDFGHESPGEGIDAGEYRVEWSGSLLVRETGRYEIMVQSTCSFTMELGCRHRQLIDNHVQSEGKEEFHVSLWLTAGRCYPLDIEFHQRKRKTEQPPARISLSWLPPGGVQEILPASNLIPSRFPPAFALQTKLPPDDRSYGYERGTAINREWDESTTRAAIEFSQFAIDELYPQYLRNHKKDADKDRAKLRGFLTDLVSTAFRRPLDEAMENRFVNRLVDPIENDGDAIKLAVIHALKSPRFLYPTLDQDRSRSYRAGNRLALTLFDSLPSDRWLQKQMAKGQLDHAKAIRNIAWRMVKDYRCQAKTRDFIYQWLDLAEVDEITKDQETYPGFNPALVADLRKSLDAFIDEVVQSETSDFRQLLQADWMFTNDRMASFYGKAWRPLEGEEKASGWQHSVSNAAQHVGVLTHPLLLSELAYHRTSSPIHRGVFLTRHIFGRVLRPPNAAFSPINPHLHPDLTTRERVELQTGSVGCQLCHSKINAVGFSLENFDATGRYRTQERKKPIDAQGSYITRRGGTVAFDGARELGDHLAESRDAHRSFVETAFEFFVKQPIAAYGPELSDELTTEFQRNDFNIRHLIVSIASIAADPPPISETQSPEGT